MKEVVVIGAGPAGLATIKSLSEYKDELVSMYVTLSLGPHCGHLCYL